MKKRSSSLIFLYIFIALVLALFSLWAVKRGRLTFQEVLIDPSDPSLFQLWEEGDYYNVFLITDEILASDPMNDVNRFLHGASLFYYAISQSNQEEKNRLIDDSVFSLRTYLSLHNTYYLPQAHYLLGKSYILKGPYYSDLALKHLSLALEMDFKNLDIEEYLAEAYSFIGDYKSSLYYLEKMTEKSPTDRLYVKIAQISYQNGDYEKAVSFYRSALTSTKDSILYQDVLYQLGTLYFNLKNYEESEKVLSQYLEIDYNNRDAHFMLGETYFYLGENSKARIEWRRAERIDPYYRPVLSRLYN